MTHANEVSVRVGESAFRAEITAGGHASGVARRASCPVLLVPPALWNA
jgi:nucleotide-binding universal stress UspA family protein